MKFSVTIAVFVSALMSMGAAPPTSAPADVRAAMRQRILRYVYDLDSPDPEARQKADDELVAIGPEVLPILKEVLAAEPSPELRVRAERIAADIPRLWQNLSKDGGQVVAGFQAILRPAKASFAAGEPVVLEVELLNAGPRTRQIVDIRGVDIEFPQAKQVFVAPVADGRLVIRAVSDVKLPEKGSPAVYDRGKPQAVTVKSGGRIGAKMQLDFALPPGKYEAVFIYYAKSKGLLGEAMEDLASKGVGFEVVR